MIVKHVCLQNAEYDRATQDRAAAELEALPKGAALRQYVGDYGQQRDRIRKCRERAAQGAG